MRKIMLALALAIVPLSGCDTVPGSPNAVASTTVVDEKGALGVELAYTAAAKAAALAIRTGAVNDPAVVRRIGEIDRRAYAAVGAARAAYDAGNAASYDAAFDRALAAVAELTTAF